MFHVKHGKDKTTMLKTNSSKAVQNIRSYIIENYDGDIKINVTFSDMAKDIMCDFIQTYLNKKRKISYQEQFLEWCAGLPTIIDTCYYYNRSAITDLGNILEETDEERNQFSESQACDMLSKLIYRELCKVCGYLLYE